ncbi:methyltransferase type 12 [Ophiostoma piceae UAMH 11346]|uniref:Methyltransferase type 12 n=1 Tax=Ophiostoma piceae (strain UAMH 11346) TaxID=1262450 RepID=S3D6F8_OPHP1|nr:methyltransferase type 12 [Ophiostoma piceae UAMH 11346]
MQTDRAIIPLMTDGIGRDGDCGKPAGYYMHKTSESTYQTIPTIATNDHCSRTNTFRSLAHAALTTSTMPNEAQPDPPLAEPSDLEPEVPRMSVPRLADDVVVDDDFPAELQPDLMENTLEVDDAEADDEQTESLYAGSSYRAVPIRYRAERFDAATINSSSRSLYVEDLDYVLENGRRYCGDYIFPNDELEQDRLRVMHQVFLQAFNFELTSVHLDEPRYILDIGTGTGEWAIGMGEEFPDCEVVGVDISAIQPSAVPHNVFFEIDDCEIDWMRPDDMIDLVHMRDMAGAISDWDFVYREALTCLKPGGHLEVLDFHDHTSSINTFLSCFPPESEIHSFSRAVDEASIKAGRRRGTHHMDVDALERMGYVDVEINERSIPFNPLINSVAKMWLIACLHTIEAGSMRLLTKYLEWEPEAAFEMCDRVCREVKAKALDSNQSSDLKIALSLLTARKPTAEEAAFLRAQQQESTDDQQIGVGNPSPMLLRPEDGSDEHDDHSGHESTSSVDSPSGLHPSY